MVTINEVKQAVARLIYEAWRSKMIAYSSTGAVPAYARLVKTKLELDVDPVFEQQGLVAAQDVFKNWVDWLVRMMAQHTVDSRWGSSYGVMTVKQDADLHVLLRKWEELVVMLAEQKNITLTEEDVVWIVDQMMKFWKAGLIPSIETFRLKIDEARYLYHPVAVMQ